jgi:hypothetical protein
MLLDRYGIKSFQFPVAAFAKANMSERLMGMNTKDPEVPSGDGRRDILSKFLQAKVDNPDFFHDGCVLTMAVSMAFAGSETT